MRDQPENEVLLKVRKVYEGAIDEVFTQEENRLIGKLIAHGLFREEAFLVADGFQQSREYRLRPSEYPFTQEGEEEVNELLGLGIRKRRDRNWGKRGFIAAIVICVVTLIVMVVLDVF